MHADDCRPRFGRGPNEGLVDTTEDLLEQLHADLFAALHRDLAESRAFYLIARDTREVTSLSKDRL